jgi:hypothetical protein
MNHKKVGKFDIYIESQRNLRVVFSKDNTLFSLKKSIQIWFTNTIKNHTITDVYQSLKTVKNVKDLVIQAYMMSNNQDEKSVDKWNLNIQDFQMFVEDPFDKSFWDQYFDERTYWLDNWGNGKTLKIYEYLSNDNVKKLIELVKKDEDEMIKLLKIKLLQYKNTVGIKHVRFNCALDESLYGIEMQYELVEPESLFEWK